MPFDIKSPFVKLFVGFETKLGAPSNGWIHYRC